MGVNVPQLYTRDTSGQYVPYQPETKGTKNDGGYDPENDLKAPPPADDLPSQQESGPMADVRSKLPKFLQPLFDVIMDMAGMDGSGDGPGDKTVTAGDKFNTNGCRTNTNGSAKSNGNKSTNDGPPPVFSPPGPVVMTQDELSEDGKTLGKEGDYQVFVNDNNNKLQNQSPLVLPPGSPGVMAQDKGQGDAYKTVKSEKPDKPDGPSQDQIDDETYRQMHKPRDESKPDGYGDGEKRHPMQRQYTYEDLTVPKGKSFSVKDIEGTTYGYVPGTDNRVIKIGSGRDAKIVNRENNRDGFELTKKSMEQWGHINEYRDQGYVLRRNDDDEGGTVKSLKVDSIEDLGHDLLGYTNDDGKKIVVSRDISPDAYNDLAKKKQVQDEVAEA